MSPTTSTPDLLDDCRWTISGPLGKLPIEMRRAILDFLPARALLALLYAIPPFERMVDPRHVAHTDEDGISILHLLAATSDKSRALDVAFLYKMLANSAVDANPICTQRSSPLAHAISSKNEKATEALLKREDVDATLGFPLLQCLTPLIYAIKWEQKRLIDLLLDREGVNVAQPNPCGRTPLSYAAEKGDVALTERLLPRYTDTDIARADNSRRKAIHYAAAAGSKEVVELLLPEHMANPDNAEQIQQRNRKPLSYAAAAGSKEVVELLLSQHGANANEIDYLGRTPLIYAAEAGSKEVVELLLSKDGVDANQTDNGKQTPLMFAAGAGSKEVVELLLSQHKVDADHKDKKGETPLLRAVQARNEEVIRLLVNADLYTGGKDDYCRGSLLLAASEGVDEKTVESLPPRPSVDAATRTSNTQHALIEAVRFCSPAVVELLLSQPDVHADEPDSKGRTPLSRAANYGNESVARLLLEEYSVRAHSRSHSSKTPLRYAAGSGHVEMVNLLLDHVKEEDLGDEGSKLLVLLARRFPELLVPKLVHASRTDINYADNDGHTALFWASKYGSTPLVELLLSHPNIDVDKAFLLLNTPLVAALDAGHDDIAILLFERRAGPERNTYGPLKQGIQRQRERFVERLLHLDADVSVTTENSYRTPPLVFAAQGQNPRIVRLLLDYYYNKERNNATSDFCLALHTAVQYHRLPAVKMLLDRLNGRVPKLERRLLLEENLPMVSELVHCQFKNIIRYAKKWGLNQPLRPQRLHELIVKAMLGIRDDELTNMDKTSPFYIALRCQVFVAQMLLDRADAGPDWSRYHFPWWGSRDAFTNYELRLRELLARRDKQTAQLRRDNMTPLPWARARPEFESYFNIAWHLLHAQEPAVNIVDGRGLTELLYALGGGCDVSTRWLFLERSGSQIPGNEGVERVLWEESLEPSGT